MTTISSALQNNRLAHAYLFTGGSPQKRVNAALEAAALLLCENNTAERACLQCTQCQKAEAQTHPDLYFVKGHNEHIKIPEIRTLKKNLGYKKFQGRRRIVIIDEAWKMTSEAANCILKVLEEPPEDTTFILLSGTKGALLPTVVSRCQELFLGQEEAFDIMEDFEKIVEKLFKGTKMEALEIAALVEKEDKEKIFLDNLMKWLRDYIVWQKTEAKDLLINEEWIESLKECQLSIEKCAYYADKALETQKVLATNASKILALENLILEIILTD